MNILILTKKFPYPLKDGEAIAIFNNIKGFSQLGHQVTVLAINTLKHHYDIKELPADVKALADFQEVTLDTSPTIGGALKNLFSGESYHVSRFVSEEYRSKLESVLKSKQFDIIQCEGLFMGRYLDTIRQNSKAPVVMRAHNVESEIWQRIAANEGNPIKKLYLKIQASRLRKYELAQLNRYDAVVPITDDDRMKLQAMGADKPMVTSPAGIDLERFNGYQLTQMKNTLFFIGGLDWLPNAEGVRWFLETVWPVAKAKHPDLEFHIAGRNCPPWLKEWKADGVTVLGEVDNALDFMARRQVMVVPLFSGSGMRIKIVEGMAMGKPIISSQIGAEGILYLDGNNIVISNTLSEYIEAIDKYMAQPESFEQIGKNARQLIESKYDNRTFAAALINFYNTQFKG